jgi:predicted nucleic acid-binding protein
MPRGGEVSEYLFETGLCLPSGTQMTEQDLHRIVTIIRNCGSFSENNAKRFGKVFKAHPEEVKKLVNHQEIPSKFTSFNITIISSDLHIIEKSQVMKRRYGFLSNDALTLQIMEDMKIKNLASNDADFERVEIITLYRPSVNTAFQK